MTLTGKVALVTGGSRGIGRAISIALAEQGADVIVNYSGNEAAAQETSDKIKAIGQKCVTIKANVADETEVKEMIKEVTSLFGQLDIMVNNAGITRDNLLMRMKEDEWDAVLDVNLKGVFNCIKSVSRQMMKQRSGRIINISSVVGAKGNPGQTNYVAAKAGVIGMTKSTALELASRGITVNAVAPGFIDTDMTAELGEDMRAELLKQIPLGRLGAPEDIANIVCFMVSDKANYMTGQTIHVDGGMYM